MSDETKSTLLRTNMAVVEFLKERLSAEDWLEAKKRIGAFATAAARHERAIMKAAAEASRKSGGSLEDMFASIFGTRMR